MLRERATTLEAVAGWVNVSMSFGVGADARTINVTQATASLFPALGTKPFAGRFYGDAEDVPENPQPPVVVSHRFWTRTLNGDPAALGRRVRLGARSYTIVGITQPGFNNLNFGAVDAWVPLHVGAPEWQGDDPSLWTTDQSSWLRVVARLKRGVPVEAANAEVARLYRTSGPRTRDRSMRGSMLWDSIEPGRSVIPSRTARLALWQGAGGALLLALIAANLTNLFRARVSAETRQTAVRLAVGGTWRDLLRGQLAESFLLAVAAAAVGLAISAPATRATRQLLFPGVT